MPASVELPPLPNVNSRPPRREAVGHRRRRPASMRGSRPVERGRPQRRRWPSTLASRRRARSASSAPASRSSPSMNGYRKSVGSSVIGTSAIGDGGAGVDQHEVAGRDGADRCVVSTVSTPPRRAHHARACGRRTAITSPSRPSSEHVMHTSSSQHGVGRRADPGCSKQTWVSSQSTWYSSTRRPSCSADCSRRRLVDPQDVVGGAASAAASRRRSRSSSAPQACGPAQHVGDSRRVAAGADRQHDVAGADQRAQRADRVGPSTLTAGSARLPTITGCTNSTATW